MTKINFSLSGGLSPAQIKDLHGAVLRVLGTTGLACAHRPTADVVTAEGGVRYEAGRLKFAPELVEATIEQVRTIGRQQQSQPRLSVTGPYNCFNIIDLDTNAVRATTAADVVPMLKLVGSFNTWGPAPVYPGDLDPRLQVLWLEKTCLETTAGLGGLMTSHDPDIIRWLGRLYAAARKRYWLSLQFVISPLRLDHLALELFWQFKDDPLVTVHADMYPIPVGGMTAPLTAPGLLAQSIAESLGGWIVADRMNLITTGQRLPMRVDFGDMRDMTMGYSLPENVMLQVLARQVAEHFGGYLLDSIYLNSNAKRADSFAAVDRTAQMVLLGLAGFRQFYMGAGQLSMDEVFSPAQFVIDLEIGRYVQRLLDGIPWSGDAETIAETIEEGAAEGNFLTHPSTLDALPTFFDSQLFRRDNVGHWRSEGEPSVEQKAVARAREIIDSYRFSLDAALQEELDRVFSEACRALGLNPAGQLRGTDGL